MKKLRSMVVLKNLTVNTDILMVIVINAADDDFDIHSSDELTLFADKGDSGILAA